MDGVVEAILAKRHDAVKPKIYISHTDLERLRLGYVQEHKSEPSQEELRVFAVSLMPNAPADTEIIAIDVIEE